MTDFRLQETSGGGNVEIVEKFCPEEVAGPEMGLTGDEAPQETTKLLVGPLCLTNSNCIAFLEPGRYARWKLNVLKKRAPLACRGLSCLAFCMWMRFWRSVQIKKAQQFNPRQAMCRHNVLKLTCSLGFWGQCLGLRHCYSLATLQQTERFGWSFTSNKAKTFISSKLKQGSSFVNKTYLKCFDFQDAVTDLLPCLLLQCRHLVDCVKSYKP